MHPIMDCGNKNSSLLVIAGEEPRLSLDSTVVSFVTPFMAWLKSLSSSSSGNRIPPCPPHLGETYHFLLQSSWSDLISTTELAKSKLIFVSLAGVLPMFLAAR